MVKVLGTVGILWKGSWGPPGVLRLRFESCWWEDKELASLLILFFSLYFIDGRVETTFKKLWWNVVLRLRRMFVLFRRTLCRGTLLFRSAVKYPVVFLPDVLCLLQSLGCLRLFETV